MNSKKSRLILATSDVYLQGASSPLKEVCDSYPHVSLDLNSTDTSILVNLLGTSQVFECKDRPTVSILFTSFLPGRSYDKNPIAQRLAGNRELDIDIRTSIKSDTQWNREIKLHQSLENLSNQIDLTLFDEIEFIATHWKHFNESGSFFEILRRFFVLKVKRTFNLNLKVGKKYLEFLGFSEKIFYDRQRDIANLRQDGNEILTKRADNSFQISIKAENLMEKRMLCK